MPEKASIETNLLFLHKEDEDENRNYSFIHKATELYFECDFEQKEDQEVKWYFITESNG